MQLSSFPRIPRLSAALSAALSLWSVGARATPHEENIGAMASAYYARSTAHPDTADFYHASGLTLSSYWRIRPQLRLQASSSFDRALGVNEEKFRTGNAQVGLGLEPFLIEDRYQLRFGLTSVLPSNQDDRDFLYYRGSLGGQGSFTHALTHSSLSILRPLRWGFSGHLSRNFFTYDSNSAGNPNTLWSFVLGVDVGYTLSPAWDLSLSLKNTRAWKANGGAGNDRYALSSALSYAWNDRWQTTLSQTTSDRTFGYDRVSPNLALYDASITSIALSIGYTL